VSKLIRIGVSAALLTWVASRMDWPQVGEAFARLRLELWLAAVALLVATQVVSAWRWRIMARSLGFDRPLPHLVGYYFIGMYFSLLLPTSVGGDVVRAWYLDGGSGRRLGAFATVFLDRLSGLIVLLAMACLSVALYPASALPSWIPWSVWGTCAAIVTGVAALPFLARWMKNGELRAQQVKTVLATLRRPGVLASTTALSAIVQVANVGLVWLVGQALQVPVPASFYWILVPMVSLLTLLPISVNGMGVREGATAILLAPLGIGENAGVTLAFLWFTVFAATSLLGGIVYLFGRFPKPESDHEAIDRDPDQGRARQSRAAA
jgi:uncharacterized membrane protein YbhN (UPF0104 family)